MNFCHYFVGGVFKDHLHLYLSSLFHHECFLFAVYFFCTIFGSLIFIYIYIYIQILIQMGFRNEPNKKTRKGVFFCKAFKSCLLFPVKVGVVCFFLMFLRCCFPN